MRANIPMSHVFETYIYPVPTRVEFLNEFGMPGTQSPAFQEWFDKQAVKTYAFFLVTHPRFVETTLLNSSNLFRQSTIQPYYKLENEALIPHMISKDIGEIFHPESLSVYFLCVLMLITLCVAGFKHKELLDHILDMVVDLDILMLFYYLVHGFLRRYNEYAVPSCCT